VCDLIDTAFPESALTPENLKHLATDRSATFVNPLGIVTVLAALGESEMLERMARAAGFLLVPVTKVDGTAAGLLAAAAAYQLDVAETEQLVAQALRDGMTEELATKILNECQEDEEKRATLVRSVHAAVPTKGRGNVRHRGH
jgi:hypothetical protein